MLARRDTVRMQKDRYYQWMKESKKERNCLKRSRLTEEVRWLVGGGGEGNESASRRTASSVERIDISTKESISVLGALPRNSQSLTISSLPLPTPSPSYLRVLHSNYCTTVPSHHVGNDSAEQSLAYAVDSRFCLFP